MQLPNPNPCIVTSERQTSERSRITGAEHLGQQTLQLRSSSRSSPVARFMHMRPTMNNSTKHCPSQCGRAAMASKVVHSCHTSMHILTKLFGSVSLLQSYVFHQVAILGNGNSIPTKRAPRFPLKIHSAKKNDCYDPQVDPKKKKCWGYFSASSNPKTFPSSYQPKPTFIIVAGADGDPPHLSQNMILQPQEMALPHDLSTV